jgi:hypothetical protein
VRHRLFTILFAMSLLLCVATVALWVRSLWFEDGWRFGLYADTVTSASFLIKSDHGGWCFERDELPRIVRPIMSLDHSEVDTAVTGVSWVSFDHDLDWERQSRSLHFRYLPDVSREMTHSQLILASRLMVPSWSLVAVFSILPVWWAVLMLHHRRRRLAGCCPTCGYDLRTTPERCLECGAIPSSPA